MSPECVVVRSEEEVAATSSFVAEGPEYGAIDRSTDDRAFKGQPVIQQVSVGFTGPEGAPEIKTFTRWAVCVFKDADDSDGWTTAEVVGLSGVASEGRTEVEALENIKEAIALAVEEPGASQRSGHYLIPSGGRVVYVAMA